MSIANYARTDRFIGRGLDAFALRSRLLREIDKRKSQRATRLLEIGCGKGNLLIDLLRRYPALVLAGINKNSAHGIRSNRSFQRRIQATEGHKFIRRRLPTIYFADAAKLPFASESFDIVISQVTFLHVPNKARAIEEVYRVLKPRGIAIVSLGPYSLRRRQGHAMLGFYRDLRKTLGTDFNPRFLIREDRRFLRASEFFQKFRKYGLQLQTYPFVSESQRGVAHWLIITKRMGELSLGLKYLSRESRKLTEAFAGKNPVNWGVIDAYRLIR